jgi:hypothetical protein
MNAVTSAHAIRCTPSLTSSADEAEPALGTRSDAVDASR